MEYTKHTWKKGDRLTTARLNNMEDGIAAANGNTGDTSTTTDIEKLVFSIDISMESGEVSNETLPENIENCDNISIENIYLTGNLIGTPLETPLQMMIPCITRAANTFIFCGPIPAENAISLYGMTIFKDGNTWEFSELTTVNIPVTTEEPQSNEP